MKWSQHQNGASRPRLLSMLHPIHQVTEPLADLRFAEIAMIEAFSRSLHKEVTVTGCRHLVPIDAFSEEWDLRVIPRVQRQHRNGELARRLAIIVYPVRRVAIRRHAEYLAV